MKSCSVSLAMRKKFKMRYLFILTRLVKIINLITPSVDKDVEQMEPHVLRAVTGTTTLENNLA